MGGEVCEVCDPPIEEVEGDTFDHPRIWRDFGTDEWRTNYPPPPGFTGFEQGDWDDETYLRALSDEELAGEAEAPLPTPGKTTIFYALKGAFRAPFDDRFALVYDVVVDPAPANQIHLTERPPVPCRFLLTAHEPAKSQPIAVIDELHHGGEFYAGNVASFSSELFDIPSGTTAVALTNLGCRNSYQLAGGTARIGPVGEHLMIPIYIALAKWLGLLLAGIGVCIGLLGYARGALRDHRLLDGTASRQ